MKSSRSLRRAGHVGGHVLKYVLLGPAFGGMLMWLWMALSDRSGSDSLRLLEGLPRVMLFAYLLGLIPAVLTGLVVGLLAEQGRLRFQWAVVGAVGFSVCLVCAAMVGGVVSPFLSGPVALGYLLFGLIGFASAVAVFMATDHMPAPHKNESNG